MEFIFTALLRDNDFQPEDQDFEFPVCFIIKAGSKAQALSWGNDVTSEHCLCNPAHELINTVVEATNSYPPHVLAKLPKITYGSMPSEEHIGW
jgi:hypothetical protein